MKLKIANLMAAFALLGSCATVGSLSDAPVSAADAEVTFTAREWAQYDDSRVYGGVTNPPHILAGTLGSYKGCLVDRESSALIVLTGAMEFHQPDGHSNRQHIYSRSMLGDRPADIIPVGSKFTVAGMKAKDSSGILLERQIPATCAKLYAFITSSETLKPR